MLALAMLTGCSQEPPRRIGVVYFVHGGFDEYSPESSWNATMQIFGYDPHSTVYRRVIWNDKAWPMLLRFGNAPKERGKYAFEYERLGGPDPATDLTRLRYRQLRENLESRQDGLGVEFIVDHASWLSEDPAHHVYPRSLYHPGVDGGSVLTYCGSNPDGGVPPDNTWEGCDPARYDTDGTVERLLAADVDEIIFIDMTTSGVRFFKTFDAVNLARQVVNAHNRETGANVGVYWVNDPTDLMTESYPTEPAGWTRSLGAPEQDRPVSIKGRPNPISDNPRLAGFHVNGIERHFRDDVDRAKTGVMLINHATRNLNQLYDPKIDDTVVLNQNIKTELLYRHGGLVADNIVGAWMGRKQVNPAIEAKPPAFSQLERTREMRGENLGAAWLYETDEELPGGEWGYRYWEALEHLQEQGVEHIVIAFPQIMVDSVLNMVELPNQMAKEIGFRNWAYIDALDFDTYPDVGHPFADYWGVWVDRSCATPDGGEGECCFVMGGCADGRPYPPPRQAAANESRDDLDPSLAFDVSEYGHLGFDPAAGPADPAAPVQEQYRGTWATWTPPNDDPAVAAFLADMVVWFLDQPRSEWAARPAAILPIHAAARD